MKINYEMIRLIFIQNALSRILLDQKMEAKGINSFMDMGDFDYWAWRYVFMKDVTKKHMTNKFLNHGFDNLTTIEIMNALNEIREIVKDMTDEARSHLK